MREVTLPAATPGRLFLSRMPGRVDVFQPRPFSQDSQAIADHGIALVVCLAPLDEVRRKSPDYARALEAGDLPWEWLGFPVADFSVPTDRDGFLRLARDLAARLQAGERVLIHCAAGIGRTGLLAVCVLMVLGMECEVALDAVRGAGAGSEAPEQNALIRWVEMALRQGSG